MVPPLKTPLASWAGWLALLLAASLSWVPSAWSQSTPGEVEVVNLTLRQAMRLGRRRAPALGVARARRDSVASLRDAASSAWPLPPSLQLTGGPRVLAGNRKVRPDLSVSLWQSIPIVSRTEARERVAAATGRRADAAYGVTEAEVGLETALAWVDARIARERCSRRRRSLADATTLLELALARVEAGADDPSTAELARGAVGAADADLMLARGALTEALIRLGHLVGTRPSRLRAVGPLALDLSPPERRVKRLARKRHPRLQLSRPEVELARARADLALANAAPSVSVGPSVTREGTGDWVFLAQVAIPLPFMAPGAFAAAQSERTATIRLEEEKVMSSQVERDMRLLLHHRHHAFEQRARIEQLVVAPLRRALKLARDRYTAGKGELSPVLRARRQVLDAEDRWLRATAEVDAVEVHLAHATGTLRGDS